MRLHNQSALVCGFSIGGLHALHVFIETPQAHKVRMALLRDPNQFQAFIENHTLSTCFPAEGAMAVLDRREFGTDRRPVLRSVFTRSFSVARNGHEPIQGIAAILPRPSWDGCLEVEMALVRGVLRGMERDGMRPPFWSLDLPRDAEARAQFMEKLNRVFRFGRYGWKATDGGTHAIQ